MPLGNRTRRSAHGNRWGLGLLGILLAGAGAVSLAAGLGAFGAGVAGAPLVGEAVLDRFRQPWVPYAGAAVAIVVALVAVRWLVVQWRSDTMGRLRVEGESSRGVTEIPAAAVRHVLEDKIDQYPGIRRAHARLTGSWHDPGVVLDITLDADADAASTWQRIHREEIATLREALEIDDLPAVVRLAMTPPPKTHTRELR